MKTIRDFSVIGRRVLVRCDFNVPLDEDGAISDDFRIKKTLPTLEYLVKNQAKVVILTHLGEPEGEKINIYKLNEVAERLQSLLKMPVKKLNDCLGQEVEQEVAALQDGHVLLLENLRFYKEETENNTGFAKKLANLGDVFINDAFGDCHRAHASMVSLPQFLPHGMGLLMQQEIEHLRKVLKNPARPLVVLVGGTKVRDKAKFIESMVQLADKVIVSGLIKKELDDTKISLGLSRQAGNSEKLLAPDETLQAPDISSKTAKDFSREIAKAKTIVWNGPFGKFEEKKYRKGTLALAKAIIKSKAFSVVGGGETIEFLHKEKLSSKFSWVSTGGGAMLKFLSGEELPGLKALEE